jgi:hypothetical protein
MDRRSQLLKKVGGTSETSRMRQTALRELNFIASVIAKMMAR